MLRGVYEPSSLAAVAEAVSIATQKEQRVYVERLGQRFRWSLTDAGGMYPLLRITARFLQIDYHGLVIGFRSVADGVFILAGDPATDKQPDAWAVLEFDGSATAAEAKARIDRALARTA